MKRLRIELPNYAEREIDLNTIAYIADKYDLDYDTLAFPAMKIYDDEKDHLLLESEGKKKCYISGENEAAVESFLKELKNWISD